MPLSDDERKRLRELEEELAAQDPHLAQKLGTQGLSNRSGARRVYGLLVTIAGLALVILGISLQLTIVGVMGFLASGAGAYIFLDSFSPHWPSPGQKTRV
ncbi:DUF3040 domain-containing protein [Arthrobacter crystallopoietes]|uniref:DUF3040 domain-containing protein n=1 Tax=Crystallibacter crystallopoietes TaxID=37928 RepID=UPI0011112AAC|nr:DUF3040 domain-containing protein [Arthrobacter crystallopoietes]